MADEGSPDTLRDRFVRYVVSPELLRELAPRKAARRRRSNEGGLPEDAVPVLAAVPAPPRARVIVELSADFPGGVDAARDDVIARLERAGVDGDRLERARRTSTRYNVFAGLGLEEVQALVGEGGGGPSPIYKVWRDERLKPFLDRSVRTIKADACLTAFGADGRGIVVAVADSGIDGTHPHFARYANLVPPPGLGHRDFTDDGDAPLVDGFGHGTHVAGIVAGHSDPGRVAMYRVAEERDAGGTVATRLREMKGDADGEVADGGGVPKRPAACSVA